MLRRAVIAVTAGVVFIAIGIGVAIYSGALPLPWNAKPAEYHARYFPDDVVAYAWLTLNPAMGQREQMMEAWEGFQDIEGFREWVGGIEDDLVEETGFDLAEEMRAWSTGELSAAVLDLDDERIKGAVVIGLRNRNAAGDFLGEWLRNREEKSAVSFEQKSINGYDSWVDEDNEQAYALTDEALVFATDEETLTEVLVRAAGTVTRTLASDGGFVEARAALPERRFTSVYIDYQRVLEVFGGLPGRELLDLYTFGLGIPPMSSTNEPCNGALSETPDWMISSGAWVDRGLVFSTISPAVDDLWPEASEVGDVAQLLPRETLGFLSMSFDPDIDNWRVAFRECKMADLLPFWGEAGMGPEEINEAIALAVEANSLPGQAPPDDAPNLATDSTLADVLDLGMWTIDQVLGIHPEDDFFDYLGGELFLAVYDVEAEDFQSSESADTEIGGVSILPYRPDGERQLTESVGRLAGRIESLVGLEVEQVDVGADNDAHVFKWDGQEVQPGYVIHGGNLTFGTTKASLETTVSLQEGGDAGLSAGEEYLRTVGHLSGGGQFLSYLDLRRIMGKLGPDVAEADLGMDRGLYEVLSNGFSAVATSSSAGEEHDRSTVVLSFLPGE